MSARGDLNEIKGNEEKKGGNSRQEAVFLLSRILSLRWGLGILGLEDIHLHGLIGKKKVLFKRCLTNFLNKQKWMVQYDTT